MAVLAVIICILLLDLNVLIFFNCTRYILYYTELHVARVWVKLGAQYMEVGQQGFCTSIDIKRGGIGNTVP